LTKLTHGLIESFLPQIPTFVAFDGEEMVKQFSGADISQLEAMVEELKNR
jgi:hypothetical protein